VALQLPSTPYPGSARAEAFLNSISPITRPVQSDCHALTSADLVSASLTVQTLGESAYKDWAGFVADSPDGSVYATAEYLDALCVAAGGRFRILAVRRADQIVGGVPLYEQASTKGVIVSPRLLLYYLGPVLKRSESKYPSQQSAHSLAMLGTLADAVSSCGYSKVTLKARHTLSDIRPFLARGWSSWPTYSYVVPLHDLPGQWHRVEQNLRRLIDRCAEQNITCTDDDDFVSFLRLHKLTMAHHDATLYLPDAAFRQWFAILHRSGLCRLFHARLPNGQPIATQIVLLGDHPTSHTVSAAIDPEHRQLGAAAFLRWRAFEWLAERGKTGNDLTDAALNSVTHFKSQFGGDLVTNLMVSTPGTMRWRAGSRVEGVYFGLRRRASALVRRFRNAKGT
jgi:GNAT acetyltransferase-like protein